MTPTDGIQTVNRHATRRASRAEFGNCLCGTPIAWHYTDDNRRLPCNDPRVVEAQLHRVVRLRRSR